MNPVRSLHQSAAEFSVFGDVAKAKGKMYEARLFYQKAFELEKDAAQRMEGKKNDHINRCILLRSTAALAYHAGLYEEAEKYIELTLSEYPPDFIKNELDEIAALVKNAKPACLKDSQLNIEGKLSSATENEIIVVEKNGATSYSIRVPAKKLKEIVREFFLETVCISAAADPGGFYLLKNINKAV